MSEPGSASSTESTEARHEARSHGVKVSSACTACRQRRSKCTGHLPCSLCRRFGTPCQYNESLDRRRKPSKRKLEDLQLDSDLLDGMLTSMKSQEFNGGNDIVTMVRNGATKDELREWLADQQRERSQSKIRRTMSIERLCDQPLVSVPASPWTSLTDDDGVVSHLVSLHLAWPDASVLRVLDHDLFVRDMAAGNLSTPHCSPLLVNAILANGCQYCNEPWACAVPSNLLTRGLHFFDEAMRLWQAESFEPSISGLQALTILITVSAINGQDRVNQMLSACSSTYMRQVENLQMDQLREQYGPGFDLVEVQRSQQHALWGAFRFQVAKHISYRGPTHIRLTPPRCPSARRDAAAAAFTLWMPFPAHSPRCSIQCDEYGPKSDQLFALGAEMFNSVMVGDPDVDTAHHESMLRRIFDKLQAFYDTLPQELISRLNTQVPLHPIQYDILLVFHWFKLILCTLMPSADVTRQIPGRVPEFTSEAQKAERLQNAIAVAALVAEWQAHYDSKHWPTLMPWSCALAAMSIIDQLEQPEFAEHFQHLWTLLSAVQERWSVYRAIGRMVVVLCLQERSKLRPETLQLIDEVANRGWQDEEVQHFAANEFPTYGDAEEGYMRDFLLQTSGLSLRDPEAQQPETEDSNETSK